MDYEKKYKEAFKWIESLYPKFSHEQQMEAEAFFPELAESEDERIRKSIHIYLDWLDGRKDYAPRGEYSIRDMISWLEKQGEQKVGCTTLVETITIPESKIVVNENKEWNEEDNKWIESLIQTFEDEYLEGFNQLKSYGVINWLKSLKERINGKQ